MNKKIIFNRKHKTMKMYFKKVVLLGLIAVFFNCKQKTSEAENTSMTNESAKIESSINITPIEHATFVMTYKDAVIYVDPVGGAEAFKGQPKPNLILVTDIHGDHLNVETLKAFNAPVIAPQAAVDQMPASANINSTVLNNGATKSLDIGGSTITLEAIPMYNLREEALKFHPKGRGNGYVLTLGEERIYISGDTEDIPEMRELKDIDMAFVCMNLPYTMTVERAADAVLEFKPAQVYPYHYRGRPDVSDVSKFRELVNEGNPEIEVVQLDWYPSEEY